MNVSERPFTFDDLSRAVQRSAGFAGLGQTCPSAEQLAGISDPNDPCQNPLAALPVTSSTAAPVVAAVTNAQLQPGTVAPGYTSIFGLQISNTALVIGAILLGGAFVLGAKK